MTVVADDLIAQLRISADLLEWSERASLRGNRERLWRKHTALQRRIDSPRPDPRTVVNRLLHFEVEAWIEVMVASLPAEVLAKFVPSLSPRGGLWAGLDRERQMEIAEREKWRQRSSSATVAQAFRRFRVSPSLAAVDEALRALEDLIEIAYPRRPRFSTEELTDGLGRLIAILNSELPAGAADYLGSLVEARFTAGVDPRWLAGARSVPRKGRRTRAWTPSWQQLDGSNARVEPGALRFLPEAQRAYDELRLAQELDQAHVEALAEGRRRTNEIAEEERRVEDLASLEKEREVGRRELKVWDDDAPRRCEDRRAQLDREAPELAKRELAQELQARGLTLKSIHRDQREWLLMERTRLVRERREEDIKGQEETQREALVERIEGVEACIAAQGAGNDPTTSSRSVMTSARRTAR